MAGGDIWVLAFDRIAGTPLTSSGNGRRVMGKIKVPVDPTRVEEIRLNRNWVRAGDLVRVAPPLGSPPGTHGFPARFQYAAEDKGGVYVCVIGLERNEKGVLVPFGFRFVKPSRLQRKATTMDPVRQAAVRKEAKRGAS